MADPVHIQMHIHPQVHMVEVHMVMHMVPTIQFNCAMISGAIQNPVGQIRQTIMLQAFFPMCIICTARYLLMHQQLSAYLMLKDMVM